MVPNGVSEGKLAEAGFMYNQEKGSWYHQGTEFGRRKAEPEDRSIEKMVNFLEVTFPVVLLFITFCVLGAAWGRTGGGLEQWAGAAL